MKNLIILSFFLLFVSNRTSCQTLKEFKFEIDGTINADTGKIYLCFYDEYNFYKLPKLETTVNNNKFSFAGFITEPQGGYILFGNHYMSSDFIIDKEFQTISINIDSTKNVPIVLNNPMQNEFPLFLNFFKQYNIKKNICDQKYDSIYRLNNYQLPEEVKYSKSKELDKLYKEHDKLLLNYTEKNPSSRIAFWKLVHLMDWGYEPIFDSIYNSFSDSLKNGYAGSILKTKILEGKQLSAGKYFPLIPCTDLNNKPFVLDIFKNNKYTLVDFWHSSCGPCRAQFDKLKDLYDQFSTKGFEIVAISSDGKNSQTNWKNVILTKKLIWKQYWDINGIETKKLGINAFPSNYLIDKSGKVITKNISLEELTQLLDSNLGSPKAIEP